MKRQPQLTKKENALISLYAEAWNEKFYECAGNHYVGITNIEQALTDFLRAYKKEKGEK